MFMYSQLDLQVQQMKIVSSWKKLFTSSNYTTQMVMQEFIPHIVIGHPNFWGANFSNVYLQCGRVEIMQQILMTGVQINLEDGKSHTKKHIPLH